MLYANRALTEVCGTSPGELPYTWQIAPQFTTDLHIQRQQAGQTGQPDGSGKDGEGRLHELDLPLETVSPGATKPPLPAVSHGCAVMLHRADTSKPSTVLGSLHRIPFW